MPLPPAPARAVIDLDAIARNFRFVRSRVGPRRAIYAVVKADAYGHGSTAVARRLEREGADRFAVANAQEGIELRRAGVRGEILLLSHAEPADLPSHRAYGLTPTLYDVAQARFFLESARLLSGILPVQLEVDTGMGRAGIRPEDLADLVAALKASPHVELAGTFANLSAADDPSSPETARQVLVMVGCLERIRAMGVSPGLVHVANSAGVLAHADSWFDGVRPGLALYGVSPSEELACDALSPAMTIEAEVAAVRRLPAGTPLGYGGRFVTTRETTVAVTPIGYHDGLRRALSGKISVLLRGGRAPVVGAISMDVTLVDATETGAARGDRVVFLGREGGLGVSAWDIARAAGTIPYEILCGMGRRLPRAYLGGDAGC